MSFVINTTVDKNQELLDAYKESFENDEDKDVFLISNRMRIGLHSYALALSSDFFCTILSENHRDTINIIIPDVDPEILKKVVEYIYLGFVYLDSRYMADFIDACNLLHLKATISCERKLIFDKIEKSAVTFTTPTLRAASTPTTTSSVESVAATAQTNLDSLIEDLEEETVEYHLKQEEGSSGQILEVYEISNIEETEMAYDTNEELQDDEMAQEQYELVNVINNDSKMENTIEDSGSRTKSKSEYIELKQSRLPHKPVDEEIMSKAIEEIFENSFQTSFRTVSEKYQIPKTLLWRRAKKLGYEKGEKQKDSTRLLAIEAIKQGESLISLSKKFNIPISTLHREKLKLYEKGELPESVNLKNRSRGEDYEDRLRAAISEILNGKSQNEIAKKFSIPKTTLWRIFKKMDPNLKISSTGRNSTPDPQIVEHLMKLSKKRSTPGKEDIKEESEEGSGIIINM